MCLLNFFVLVKEAGVELELASYTTGDKDRGAESTGMG